MPKLTVIISYYKSLDNLKIILQALENQSCLDFEVIVSEDDNNIQTLNYIKSIKSSFKFAILHLNQTHDEGFKKAVMLNRSIVNSKSEKIAFIDGDCVPHKYFVKQYIDSIDSKSFCVGRSVVLDKKTTEILKATQNLKLLNFFKLLFSKTSELKNGIYFPYFQLSLKTKGLLGRNWGCHRKNLLDINGFDEDYKYAGISEDTDVEWRLISNGIYPKSVKNKAIVYHLYHSRWYSDENERTNYKLMEQKIVQNQIKCNNGIAKLKS